MRTTDDSRVTAVVAAHRPDERLEENLHRLAGQVDRVIVVDDGSGSDWDDLFAGLRLSLPERLTVLRLPRNDGIAHALNRGVQTALDEGCGAVVTFDQDSAVADDYVRSMVDAAARLIAAGRSFAAIAAGVQSGAVVRPVHYQDRGDALTPTLEAIQSGLFIPATVFERVGVFDEELFIDCVDTDFLVRAAAVGLPTYLCRSSAIEHPLGRLVETPRLRITRRGSRSFAYHPAWRRYYISRNRAVMLARHGARRPAWAAASLAGEIVQLLRCLAFGPDKRRQGVAVAIGLTDALQGRRGKLIGRRATLLDAPR